MDESLGLELHLGWAFLEPKHDYRFSTTDNSTLGLGRDWAQLSNSSA